jgi:hypothetical protein
MIIVVFTRESSPVTVRAHGILTPTIAPFYLTKSYQHLRRPITHFAG